MDLEDFLSQNRINKPTWESANIEWPVLVEIATDHLKQQESLRATAELFARVVQRFPTVHSVRWRIKSVDHLLEKIVRKRAENQEKYNSISPSNYFEVVTDLVGIRALHLFKDDCFSIDTDIRATWIPAETPTAYVREGDPHDLTAKFKDQKFEVKSHPAGYRSVHYVCPSQPLQRKTFVEIQVRTIFEEGWSEIDHRIRYPNFSNDELVSYFLTIFNRLAGSADEMGTFVQGLTNALRASSLQLSEATKQKEEAFSAMGKTLGELESMKMQDAATSTKLANLQQEVAKLRQISIASRVGDLSKSNALAAMAGLDVKSILSGLSLDSGAAAEVKKINQRDEDIRRSLIRKLRDGG